MILNYFLYRGTYLKKSFLKYNWKNNTFIIYINQKNDCRVFRKVSFFAYVLLYVSFKQVERCWLQALCVCTLLQIAIGNALTRNACCAYTIRNIKNFWTTYWFFHEMFSLLDNCNTLKYLLAEISLFSRPIHHSLRGRFVVVSCFPFLLRRRYFVTLHKIFFHQMSKQKQIVKYKKENFMIFIIL